MITSFALREVKSVRANKPPTQLLPPKYQQESPSRGTPGGVVADVGDDSRHGHRAAPRPAPRGLGDRRRALIISAEGRG